MLAASNLPLWTTRTSSPQQCRNARGIGFAQLQRETGLANGVLQHHLRTSPAIEQVKDAYTPTNFCATCPLQDTCDQICSRKLLHDPVKQELLTCLESGLSQADIARCLDRDRSTISYHIQRLEKYSLISEGRPTEPVKTVLTL